LALSTFIGSYFFLGSARKFSAAWGFAQQIILKGVVGFTAHKAIGNNNLHFKIVQYGKSEGIFVLNIYGIAKCVKYGAKNM